MLYKKKLYDKSSTNLFDLHLLTSSSCRESPALYDIFPNDLNNRRDVIRQPLKINPFNTHPFKKFPIAIVSSSSMSSISNISAAQKVTPQIICGPVHQQNKTSLDWQVTNRTSPTL